MRKIVLLMILILTVSLASIGCNTSKSSYEKRMTDILKKTSDDLKKINLSKVPANDKEKEKQSKEIKSTIDDFQKKVTKIKPPEDYFEGHSDIKEFAKLFLSYQEEQLKDKSKEEKKNEEQGITILNNQEFEGFQSSRRAFERAKQQLPILEYELQQTFNELFQSQQPSPYGMSPFGNGATPPNMNSGASAEPNASTKDNSDKKD